MWSQTYFLFGNNLAISALIAAVPIFTLLLLLGVLRKPAWIAGFAGLAISLVLAVAGYHMPLSLALSSAAHGAAFGLFPISWIVFWAIALFRLTVDTGKFEIIKESLGRLTSDRRMQALLIAFAFGAFIEGASGFGTPVAVSAAMLTGLGFPPLRAAAICLLANTAPVAFGSIGIPIVTLAGITGLPLDKLSAAAGRLCAPVSLFIPAYLVLAVGGIPALQGAWLPAVVAGVSFAATQYLMSNFVGPQLTDILAAIVTDDEAEALLAVEEFDGALALADNLRRHAAATRAAEAAATASTTAGTGATEAATAAASAAAEATAATATGETIAAAAAATTGGAHERVEILLAEPVALVSAPAATPSIETHKPERTFASPRWKFARHQGRFVPCDRDG